MSITQDPNPTYEVVRFSTIEMARANDAYLKAHRLISSNDCDLSMYSFQLKDFWYIVIVGNPPSDENLAQELGVALSEGTRVGLDNDGLACLHERIEIPHSGMPPQKRLGPRWKKI